MLDENQQHQGEEGPPRGPEQVLPMGKERASAPHGRDAHGQGPDPGRGPRATSPRPCPAQLGPHPPGTLSQLRTHPSNSPRCTAGCLLLHSSSSREEVSAQILCTPRGERLNGSGVIYRISKFLIPLLPPQRQGDFSQTFPKLALLRATSSAGPEGTASAPWTPPRGFCSMHRARKRQAGVQVAKEQLVRQGDLQTPGRPASLQEEWVLLDQHRGRAISGP